MEKIKEKPKYNVWQNSLYIIKYANKYDKSVMRIVVAQIFLTVAIAIVTLFLPKAVIEQISMGLDIKSLVFTILGFTFGLVVLGGFKTYFDMIELAGRNGLRLNLNGDILKKVTTTDYANLDKESFNNAKAKAQEHTMNGRASTERIYYCFVSLGTSILGFIIYSFLLVSINPIILIFTAFSTVIGYFVRQWANKWHFEHEEESTQYDKRLYYLAELGSKNEYAKDIRLFGMIGWLDDIHKSYLKLAYDFEYRVQKKHFLADATDCIVTFLREGIAYGYLVWQLLEGNLTADMFVLYFGAIGGFSGYIMGILNEYSVLTRHSLNYCKLREFFEYPDEFTGVEGEPITYTKDYSLEARNVSFKYSGSDKYVLENLNLHIKAGEKLAIVGLNGAGKTTLVKLLCGFYDPTEGEILLNGKNIKSFNRKEYYKLFTAVFQEFNILPATILENITNGTKEEADFEKLYKCFEMADIDKKIMSLHDKEDSFLVKDAINDAVELSGGETQRLMLARALYKNSPILILDEPTSALDPIAEHKLYEKYNELSEGKTSLYISHRLASTRFCDRIILLGEKGILEEGTHEELLKLKGKYYDLYDIQSKYYKEDKGGDVDGE